MNIAPAMIWIQGSFAFGVKRLTHAFARCLLTIIAIIWVAPAVAQVANTPPQVINLKTLRVNLGTDIIITQEELKATDVETVDPSKLVYRIFPDDRNFRFVNGGLWSGTRLLRGGDDFTQATINSGKLFWRAPTNTDAPRFVVPFRVQDASGAEAAPLDGGTASGVPGRFALVIEYINTPPVAQNGSIEIPIASFAEGKLTASNAESYQKLTYRIVTPPAVGTLVLKDASTGEFRFTAPANAKGEFEFTFQVSDGQLESVASGAVKVFIQDARPIVIPKRFVLEQNGHITGKLEGIDPDVPPQPLTWEIVQQPAKGRIENFDSATGNFTYYVHENRFGNDSFKVIAKEAVGSSNPTEISLYIHGFPDDGTLLIAGKDAGRNSDSVADDQVGIYMANPLNGDLDIVYEGPELSNVLSIAYSVRTEEIIFGAMVNNSPYLGGVEIRTGKLRPLVVAQPPLLFPIHISIGEAGELLVANGEGGILQVDLETGEQRLLPNSLALKFATAVFQLQTGNLLALDSGDLFSADARVYLVNPTNGTTTVLLDDPSLKDVGDFEELANGHFLVSASTGLIEFNPETKTATNVVNGNFFQSFPKEVFRHGEHVFVNEFEQGIWKYDAVARTLTNVSFELPLRPTAITIIEQPITTTEWLHAYFHDSVLNDPAKRETVWGAFADPDQDGIPNILEFAFILDPLAPNGKNNHLEVGMELENGVMITHLSYRFRKEIAGLAYRLETTSDLKTWATGGFTLLETNDLGDAFKESIYEYRDTNIRGARFFRLIVSVPSNILF